MEFFLVQTEVGISVNEDAFPAEQIYKMLVHYKVGVWDYYLVARIDKAHKTQQQCAAYAACEKDGWIFPACRGGAMRRRAELSGDFLGDFCTERRFARRDGIFIFALFYGINRDLLEWLRYIEIRLTD